MTTLLPDFPDRLIQAMAEAGFHKGVKNSDNWTDFATLIGVTVSSVSNYASGASVPDLRVLKRILEATGKPIEFFTGEHVELPITPVTQSRKSKPCMLVDGASGLALNARIVAMEGDIFVLRVELRGGN